MRIDPTRTDRPAAARWLLAAGAAVVAAALSAGCGDDGFPTRYPVSGTVKYNGQPLKEGTVTFAPVDDKTGRAASGFIVDGTYSLTTVKESDGAIPGKYRVSIRSAEVDLSKAEAVAKASGGAMLREDLVVKAKRKSNIPTKYSIPDTSGLTADVKETRNTFDFTLTD